MTICEIHNCKLDKTIPDVTQQPKCMWSGKCPKYGQALYICMRLNGLGMMNLLILGYTLTNSSIYIVAVFWVNLLDQCICMPSFLDMQGFILKANYWAVHMYANLVFDRKC